MTDTRRSRVTKGLLAFTASAAALAAAAGTAVAAGDPAAVASGPTVRGATAGDVVVQTPSFAMPAVHKGTMELYLYFPNGEGGFEEQHDTAYSFEGVANALRIDNDKDGEAEAIWYRHTNGLLAYTWNDGGNLRSKDIGRGWNTYTTVVSPGNLGGAKEADLIGVDKAGVLWLYLAHPDGRLSPRTRVGGGWGQYDQIAGQADLTRDGKADIVARDRAGVLWLYRGTGDYKAPFAGRARIGGGWNVYDRLLSVGDLDMDGTTDLLARTPGGDLLRYSGTGRAQAPFAKPVKVGHGFQHYNLL